MSCTDCGHPDVRFKHENDESKTFCSAGCNTVDHLKSIGVLDNNNEPIGYHTFATVDGPHPITAQEAIQLAVNYTARIMSMPEDGLFVIVWADGVKPTRRLTFSYLRDNRVVLLRISNGNDVYVTNDITDYIDEAEQRRNLVTDRLRLPRLHREDLEGGGYVEVKGDATVYHNMAAHWDMNDGDQQQSLLTWIKEFIIDGYLASWDLWYLSKPADMDLEKQIGDPFRTDTPLTINVQFVYGDWKLDTEPNKTTDSYAWDAQMSTKLLNRGNKWRPFEVNEKVVNTNEKLCTTIITRYQTIEWANNIIEDRATGKNYGARYKLRKILAKPTPHDDVDHTTYALLYNSENGFGDEFVSPNEAPIVSPSNIIYVKVVIV